MEARSVLDQRKPIPPPLHHKKSSVTAPSVAWDGTGTACVTRTTLSQVGVCTRAASKWIDPPALVPSTSPSQPVPIINLANPNPPGLHHSRTNIHGAYR